LAPWQSEDLVEVVTILRSWSQWLELETRLLEEVLRRNQKMGGSKGRLEDSGRSQGRGGTGGERLGWEEEEEGGCDVVNSSKF
jgi:hypothetical protein